MPQAARLHVVVCIFEGGLFYSLLPLREEGVPVPSKPFMAQGQNNRRPALNGTLWPLPSELRVPHVTSFFARAPSSLLFCGVRNTHKFLAFCIFFEEFGQCPTPS